MANENADTSTAQKEGADTSTDSQTEGKTNSQSDTSTGSKQTEGAKTFTQDEVNSLLARERKAAEKRATDAEAKAKLSEDERMKADLADARNQLAERDTRDAVIEQAQDAGVKNPKLFYQAYKSEIERDEKTGKITNLKEVLESAKTESPELFEAAKQNNGSADGGEGKGQPATGLTREQIDKMTPKEIAENMEAIDKFLASGK